MVFLLVELWGNGLKGQLLIAKDGRPVCTFAPFKDTGPTPGPSWGGAGVGSVIMITTICYLFYSTFASLLLVYSDMRNLNNRSVFVCANRGSKGPVR